MAIFSLSTQAKKLVKDRLKKSKETASGHFESMAAMADLEYYASLCGHSADATYFSEAWQKIYKMKIPKDLFSKDKQ